jgi:hypothetical protein
MSKNPFGEDAALPQRVNPFEGTEAPLDPAGRIEHAARKIRMLKSRLGAEGLTLSATRELIDELSAALDAAAKSIRERSEP